ncbi:hypothetical protein PBY51_012837 [Eleginops maclovinus]|uniref:Uncharacterized protein n=1 Tax=Eleginops maclovinus TaxID=56733 RepID=A0AAN7Y324_ELEMC|nr:hypothetical protein PBY51_012837 [Eleginops maclovinus]
MRKLRKPLRDSERYPHVWQQADRQKGGGMGAVGVSGLLGVTLAKPCLTQIIPLASPHSPPPLSPHSSVTTEGFPLTFGFS